MDHHSLPHLPLFDSRKSYEPAVKKGGSMKARVEASQKPRVSLLSVKAMVGAAMCIIYYLAMAFVGYPPVFLL